MSGVSPRLVAPRGCALTPDQKETMRHAFTSVLRAHIAFEVRGLEQCRVAEAGWESPVVARVLEEQRLLFAERGAALCQE